MAYPTKPAYIVNCAGWEPRLKEHPVFDWMFDHEASFDFGAAKQEPYTNWHTDDFTFVDASGKSTRGAEAWSSLLAVYAPLSSHFHEPYFVVIFDNGHGYELFGCAKIFANLLVPGQGQKKRDLGGREWDVGLPGAFHFKYVKDKSGNKGLKISEERLYADGLPILGKLLERGMVTPAELSKKLGA